MKVKKHQVTGNVWVYPGAAAWHFLTISKEDAQDINAEYIWERRGFGAIPVNVKLGKTKWKTSIFPEKAGTFLLPLKKEVRKAEEIKEGIW